LTRGAAAQNPYIKIEIAKAATPAASTIVGGMTATIAIARCRSNVRLRWPAVPAPD
jgi:hypothetical protein